MVIEDVTRPGPAPAPFPEPPLRPPAPPRAALAAPLDRLAAFMADFVLLVPLISLLVAPFRRRFEIAILLGDADAKVAALGSIALGAVVGLVGYQTLFVNLWAATPGKRLLGLRVVSVWTGARPSVSHSFLRSVTWCASLFFLLIPWVAVLSNRRRRPWHDRIADTEVVAVDPARGVGEPDPREAAVASSLRAAGVFALCGFATSVLMNAPETGERRAAKAAAGNPFLCGQVTETHEEWLGREGTAPPRLDVALALFGADAVSERCLELEADYALWNGMASPAAYLAKALSRADDAENYVDYARKACDKGPREPACRLARLLASGGDRDRAPAAAGSLGPLEIDELLPSLEGVAPAYLRVYAVRELVRGNRFQEALSAIEGGSPHRKLGYFFARHRAQALWGLRHLNEARLAVKSSLEGLSVVQRTALAGWLCSAENATACGEQAAASCDLLRRAVERDPAELEDPETAVAWIRGEECVAAGRPDMEKMRKLASGPAVRLLLGGIERAQAGDASAAKRTFAAVAGDSEAESAFWFEAQARLVATVEDEGELEEIQKRWAEAGPVEPGWLRLGHALLRRSESLGLSKRTLQIAKLVVATDPFDETLQKSVVVWAFHEGDLATAGRALDQVSRGRTTGQPPAEPARALASVAEPEFERVAKLVDEKRPSAIDPPTGRSRANPKRGAAP